jgi:hypothetical protein
MDIDGCVAPALAVFAVVTVSETSMRRAQALRESISSSVAKSPTPAPARPPPSVESELKRLLKP